MTWAARIPTLAGLRYPQASFVLDFANNYYRGSGAQGSSPSALPGYNFTRALAAYAEDTSGNLIQFASGVPRITNKGVLIEESRTNSIRNSTASNGAVAGVVGSGGSLPTNWIKDVGTGITWNVLGTGIEYGVDYVDVRFSGTSSGTFGNILFENNTQIVAATGQAWSATVYARLIAGSLSGVVTQISIFERDVSGAYITQGSQAVTLNSSFQRMTVNRTLSGGVSVARINSGLGLAYSSGTTMDFTLRIYAPQLEVGSFPTSYIPTTSASVTRPADVFYYSGLSISNVSTIAGAGLAPQLQTNIGRILEISDNGGLGLNIGAGNSIRDAYVGGAGITSAPVGDAVSFGSPTISVASNASGTVRGSGNGKAASALVGTATISTATRVTVGDVVAASRPLNGYIQRLAIYPFAASDAQLQSISSGNF